MQNTCGILYAKVMSSGGQGAAGQRLRDESDAAVWIECIMHPCVEVRKSMSTVTIFQIAFEFWGIVWCIIASAGILFGNARLHANRSIKLAMQAICILLLLNDSLAYIFRGHPGNTAYYMVRISNYMVFFSNYLYMGVFSIFLWRSVRELNERMPRRFMRYSDSAGLEYFCLHCHRRMDGFIHLMQTIITIVVHGTLWHS